MSAEEKRKSLCDRCVAVYKFPIGIKEEDVLSVFSEGLKASFVPDPSLSSFETESSENKWIVLFPTISYSLKYLSESIFQWKDIQLQINKVSIPCEIPDEWVEDQESNNPELTSQQDPVLQPQAAGYSGTTDQRYSSGEGLPRMPMPRFHPMEGFQRMPMPQGEGFPQFQTPYEQMMLFYRQFTSMPQYGAPAFTPGGASDNQEQTEKKSLGPNYPFPYGPWMYPQFQGHHKGGSSGDSLLPPSYEMSERQASVAAKEESHHDDFRGATHVLPTIEDTSQTSHHVAIEPKSTEIKTIKVTNIPKDTTEDALTYFFENRRKSGGGSTEEVDYDESTQTAYITFEDANAVQRVLSKLPILFNKKQIKVEEFKPEIEPEAMEVDLISADSLKPGCIIEVREFKDTTSKDTIEMYFENKRRSGGGDVINVQGNVGDGVLYLEFENEEVVERILSRSHKIDGVAVKVQMYIPPPPPKPVPTYNNKVMIHNLSSNTSRDGLENFLEAKLGISPIDFRYDDDDQSKVLVTFEEAIDIEKLKFACQRRSLDKSFLKVMKVPISSSIIVRGFSPQTSRDTMEFYFDNTKRSGGEDVLDVRLNADDGICIVVFEDPNVAEAVCARQHKIDGKVLDVHIFYECLGQINEENEGTEFAFPEPLVINDAIPRKVQFLMQSESNKMAVDKTLEACHGKVEWPKTAEEAKSLPFKVTCTLSKEIKDYKKLAKGWSKTVASEVDKYLNMLIIQHHSVVQEAWKEVIAELKSLNVSKPDGVAVSLEKAECEIYIVGHKIPVEDVSKQVAAIIRKIEEEMNRKKLKVEEKTGIKHHQVILLQALNFNENITKQFKDLKVFFNTDKHQIIFEGLSSDIMAAKMKMFEILNSVSKSDVGQFSTAKSEFLKSSAVKKYVKDQFQANNVVAVWEINNNFVVVYSTSDQDSVNASHVVKDCVLESSVTIDRESVPLFSSEIWEKQSAEQIQTYQGLVKFLPRTQTLEIVILCVDSNHGLLREFVEQFVLDNTIYEQSLELSTGIMRFLSDQCKKDTNRIAEGLKSDQVRIDVTQTAISIQGTKIGLNKAKRKIDDLVQTIEKKTHVIKKAGIGKHLQSFQGQERITKIENIENVVIELSDDSDQSEDRKSPTFDATTRQKELAVCVAPRAQKIKAMVCDMTSTEVDVMVNAANKDLKHIGGLAKAIVDKGGMVIQAECDEYVRKHKRLMEGEVFTSSPGSLSCKIIVHAVGPVWTNGQNNEEDYLREAIFKSLEEGSKRFLKSIALPALCTGVFGYPIREASRVIVEAVRDFFRENQDSSVDTVYLCDVKEDTVSHFVKALKKTFGPDNVTDKQKGSVEGNRWQSSANMDISHKRQRV